MKNSLLATAAAAALIAGSGLAIAQRQEAPATKSEAPARAPPAVQNAPAEKIAPAGRTSTDGEIKARSETRSAPAADTRSGTTTTDTKSNAQTRSGTTSTDTKSSADTKSNAPSGTTSTDTKSATDTKAAAQSSTSNSASLTSEQRARVRSSVLTANAPRVTNINFSLNIGTVVPRTVRIVAVPATLIEIHPAWRGYMYFVHGDQIIIVEPGTLRIVTIIEV